MQGDRRCLIAFDRVTVAAAGKVLLDDISFAVGEGERVVLRGRSGSGKSTVLKCLLGLHSLAQGRIRYAGEALDRVTVHAIRAAAVYVGQEPMMGAGTVREALLLPFRFKAHQGREPSESELFRILDRLRLPADLLGRECSRISGGEKQRIALARGLLLKKNLYLLDEATSALDGESKDAVFAALSQPGLTLLSVAHDPAWIEWCDAVFDLEAGRLLGEARHGGH